jgi:hypothetical protein
MQCKIHPDLPAVDRCVGCAEPFCGNCLVEVAGQRYCASCKSLALQGREVLVEEPTLPCKEAGEALTYAIISLFCFGFILGPISISKAVKAKQIIADDPRLAGYGKCNAAILIGSVGLVLSVIFVFGKMMNAGRSG